MSELFYSPEYATAIRKLEGISRRRKGVAYLNPDEAIALLDCLAGYEDLLHKASLERAVNK